MESQIAGLKEKRDNAEGRGKLILCTQGFIKKTQKTPTAEIDLAISFKEKYFKVKKKGLLKIIKREKKVNQ